METKELKQQEAGLDNNELEELYGKGELQQEVVDDEEEEDLEEEPKEDKKSLLTFFMIFFPSVIISIIPSSINGGSIIPIGIKACLLLLQLVILKNFVDTYYN